jgi:hypothetical protein
MGNGSALLEICWDRVSERLPETSHQIGRLPGDYFRYCVLFHEAKYNLTATTTKLPPEEDDRVQDCKRQTHHLRFV